MRSRNREVNIFNMSLLDILTGMLGAFLFLMLGLVPYYSRAKNSHPNQDSTPHVDTLLNVILQFSSNAHVSLYLFDPVSGWCGHDYKTAPLPHGTKIDPTACFGKDGWQSASGFASADKDYVVCYSVQSAADGPLIHSCNISVELTAAQSNTDGSGLKGYSPLTACSTIDLSGAKPGTMYGLVKIHVTQDTTKAEYYQQWNFSYDSARTGLPSGTKPLPEPLTATYQTSTIPTPAPAPAPGPSPDSAPAPTPPATATNAPPQRHWFFEDWFHKSSK